MIPPRATMRLQLHKGFPFAEAAAVIPYLAHLGISHLYASPILKARPGSMHGYDVTDPTQVNPELGGEDGFRHLVARLRSHDLGLILDMVPNHMAVGKENPWWQDVLRHGEDSQYARFFDIDWNPGNPLLQGKVLLPILGGQYGEILQANEITLARGPDGWEARYFDHVFPIHPEDAAEISANGPAAYTRDRLHSLLERQHYRLAWWRSAGDEINWRRFFNINELAALRQEIPAVFEATHALFFRLYAEGLIDGVRIDHVDGLADPGGYCRRLRARLQELAPHKPAYIIVEKILGRGEQVPADWEVDGTSGYDFMDAVSAVQHDPDAAQPLAELWCNLTGRPSRFAHEETPARREMLDRSFTAQLEATVDALHAVALEDLCTRDASRPALRRALVELLAQFPVYRSYTRQGPASPADEAAFRQAEQAAKAAPGRARPELIDLIVAWLHAPETPSRQIAATRFQQLSAPLAAKAVEDTAFYRYGRLISRNDVGFDAATLGTDPTEFHRLCAERAQRFPRALLATATHDHKRGEDVRARLALLSELPAEWATTLHRWIKRNTRHRTRPEAPSRADELTLYQTLVGAWPEHPTDDFETRIAGWQLKAMREAKLETSWASPDPQYEQAAQDFLTAILHDEAFTQEIAAVVDRIAPAGAVNGMAQTLLKLTMPGVPDFYQGTEFWDLSLVDPDNRRPVDFAAREQSLDPDVLPPALAVAWRDGRVKQAVIAAALRLRAALPDLFARGDYVPLAAEGAIARHVIAFARQHQRAVALIIVPRLPFALLSDAASVLIPPAAWSDTALILPARFARPARNVLTGEDLTLALRTPLSKLLGRFPLALLRGE
jgi:(1->4)-alpha-D-glucan 1-alpha-D-glucosylmutase